jgi:hypothetical protein
MMQMRIKIWAFESALKLKTSKNNEKQNGSTPQAEPERRTARGAEWSFEVVFTF